MKRYVAFLRGINVGGHHKVPMAELKSELQKMGCQNVVTILNSGNVLFEVEEDTRLEKQLAARLESKFGFPIPTIVRTFEATADLAHNDPFEGMEVTKNTKQYISFLQQEVDSNVTVPWTSEDGAYQIIEKRGLNIISLLDLSRSKTVKAMKILEDIYGKDITTRNWNTIGRVMKKAEGLKWVDSDS
ncbi:MAG: DUF1697 domain-containing protein [Bacteroidota bacterium]